MTFKVTRQDIKTGVCYHPRKCAVALALLRAGCRRPVINDGQVKYTRGNKRYRFEMTHDIYQFIAKFDSSQPVYPTTFTL